MDIKNDLFDKNEFKISVENISFELIAPRGKNPAQTAQTGHSHLFTELFVCFSGNIDIQTDNGIITLEKNDAVIIPANVSHYKVPSEDNENWNAVGFTITKKHNAGSFDLYSKLAPICLNLKPSVFSNVPELCNTIEAIHKILRGSLDCLPVLELVCILLKLATQKAILENLDTKKQMRSLDLYRMAWFEDIIGNRFYEPLTISKLAEALHISSRQLSRIIKEQYGTTFHTILKRKRLKVACKLFISTERSVIDILKEVGYNKSSAFYNDFFEEFNMTPTEYRKNFSVQNNE